MKFGTFIKNRREQLGYSRSQAAVCGIQANSWSSIERGRTRSNTLTEYQLGKLAQQLKLDLKELTSAAAMGEVNPDTICIDVKFEEQIEAANVPTSPSDLAASPMLLQALAAKATTRFGLDMIRKMLRMEATLNASFSQATWEGILDDILKSN